MRFSPAPVVAQAERWRPCALLRADLADAKGKLPDAQKRIRNGVRRNALPTGPLPPRWAHRQGVVAAARAFVPVRGLDMRRCRSRRSSTASATDPRGEQRCNGLREPVLDLPAETGGRLRRQRGDALADPQATDACSATSNAPKPPTDSNLRPSAEKVVARSTEARPVTCAARLHPAAERRKTPPRTHRNEPFLACLRQVCFPGARSGLPVLHKSIYAQVGLAGRFNTWGAECPFL